MVTLQYSCYFIKNWQMKSRLFWIIFIIDMKWWIYLVDATVPKLYHHFANVYCSKYGSISNPWRRHIHFFSKIVHFSSQTMLLVCNPSLLNLNLNLRSVYGCWLLILLDNYKTDFLCYKWKDLRLFMLFILWDYCDRNYHFHCLNTVYVQLKSLTLLCSYLAMYYVRTCQRNNLIT